MVLPKSFVLRLPLAFATLLATSIPDVHADLEIATFLTVSVPQVDEATGEIKAVELDSDGRFSLGDNHNVRCYSAKSRRRSSGHLNECLIRIRVDARVGQTRILWGGPETLTVHDSSFNSLANDVAKTYGLAEMRFAHPNPDSNRGSLTNGAKWGLNFLTVSDSTSTSRAKKPSTFVFELIDGNGDKRFNSPSDKLIVRGLVYDPDFLNSSRPKNAAAKLHSVRATVAAAEKTGKVKALDKAKSE